MKRFVLSIFVAAIFLSLALAAPVWEDQIVYFVMIDRFANGDTSNDDMGFGEAGNDNSRYNGGDIRGLIDRLDYIKELGATTVWITPPIAAVVEPG